MKTKNNFDILYISVLIILSVVAVYFIPAIKTIFLIFSLVLFFKSNPRNDYFWVFFVSIFIDNPGNLFWKTTDEIIKVGPIAFSFLQCFIITAVFKILHKKHLYKNVKIFFARDSKPYFIWLTFLLVEGLFIGIGGGGSTGYRYYYYYALTFIIFPIFFVMPYLIKNMPDLIKLFKLISIFVILNFISQTYNIVIGQSLHTLMGGIIPIGWDDITSFENALRMLRPIYFVYSTFFAFILAPFFLYIKKQTFNRAYLYLILITALFSITLTATRGWIIAFLVYLVSLIFVDIFFTKRFVPQKIIISLVITASILIPFVPVIQTQFFKSLDRMEPMSFILQDPTLGGTNTRFTTRLYPVMEKFEERPITGWGFSRMGMEIYDGHVGNASILMVGGIVGALILLFFLFRVFNKIFIIYKNVSPSNNYKKGIIVLSVSIIILLIIHSSSAQVFGYYRYIGDGGSGALWVSLYFAILNLVYNAAIEDEKTLGAK